LNKLKNKFYDVLEFEKFTVKGIKTQNFVTTFRVQKMSEFLTTNIETFKSMLETEVTAKQALEEELQSFESSAKVDESKREQSMIKQPNQTQAATQQVQ
jgi:hypothetical protein